MAIPNFFIVGAPKCGTTALQVYLGEHPNIFLCEPKEPNYFSTDFPSHCYVRKKSEYLKLFDDATEDHLCIGEASAWYLYSKTALENIRKFDRNAKIIVMVRNPLDMFPSLHGMLALNFMETELDFEKAWYLQEARKKGECLPKGRNETFDVKTLFYADVCKVGDQLERLYTQFPRQKVHVVIFDDFMSDTKACYEDILSFLGVPSDGRLKFPPINVRRSFRSRRLAWLVWKLRDAGGMIKRRLGIVRTFNVLEILSRPIEKKEKRPVLTDEFRTQLKKEFRSDIEKLSKIIDRDLSHWLA